MTLIIYIVNTRTMLISTDDSKHFPRELALFFFLLLTLSSFLTKGNFEVDEN